MVSTESDPNPHAPAPPRRPQPTPSRQRRPTWGASALSSDPGIIFDAHLLTESLSRWTGGVAQTDPHEPGRRAGAPSDTAPRAWSCVRPQRSGVCLAGISRDGGGVRLLGRAVTAAAAGGRPRREGGRGEVGRGEGGGDRHSSQAGPFRGVVPAKRQHAAAIVHERARWRQANGARGRTWPRSTATPQSAPSFPAAAAGWPTTSSHDPDSRRPCWARAEATGGAPRSSRARDLAWGGRCSAYLQQLLNTWAERLSLTLQRRHVPLPGEQETT